jgi:hypothetical protein
MQDTDLKYFSAKCESDRVKAEKWHETAHHHLYEKTQVKLQRETAIMALESMIDGMTKVAGSFLRVEEKELAAMSSGPATGTDSARQARLEKMALVKRLHDAVLEAEAIEAAMRATANTNRAATSSTMMTEEERRALILDDASEMTEAQRSVYGEIAYRETMLDSLTMIAIRADTWGTGFGAD